MQTISNDPPPTGTRCDICGRQMTTPWVKSGPYRMHLSCRDAINDDLERKVVESSRFIRLVSPHEGCRLPLSVRLLPLPVDPIPTAMTCSFRSAAITPLHRYCEAVRPSPVHRYFRPRGFSACAFSLGITGQVLKFRRKARMRVTPPLHRTPHGQ